ncbi:hypothetical protein ACJEIK_21495 [Mycobacterium sp. SMC-16]|uniref:hypothetical protein n=1 Tax=Mycobacterium sp. SMC-16 TaxID=3385967 RepID=UPI00390C5B17
MPHLRAARAGERALELARLRTRLLAGRPVTAEDLELAGRRAQQSRQWALEACLRAAERHEAAASAHDRAARVHENLRSEGHDAAAHQVAAEDHRCAARLDRDAALQDRRRAAELAVVELPAT